VKKYIEERIPDVRLLSIQVVDLKFNPRSDALSKTYAYKIYTTPDDNSLMDRDYQINYYDPLKIRLMKQGAKLLKGTHDFYSFTGGTEYNNTIRTIN
jgi:tRNA pseudouridine(38-40) synthase